MVQVTFEVHAPVLEVDTIYKKDLTYKCFLAAWARHLGAAVSAGGGTTT